MVVKIYISGISGNKEVKKRQQRVLMILDSKSIKYDIIDITEPGREADKDFMQNNSKSNGGTVSDPNPRSPLPPQVFNDDEYCGDYDQFDLANEVDTLEQFLKVEVPPEEPPVPENEQEKVLNGGVEKVMESESKENSQERETGDGENADGENEDKPTKEKTPSRETTPADRVASKEASPAKDENESEEKEESPSKESSPERQKSVEKEKSVEREKSVEKEEVTEKESSPLKEVELESKKSTKENTPEKEQDKSVNENGTVSSREQSEEKEPTDEAIERKKDTSEALIESEQAAAAE